MNDTTKTLKNFWDTCNTEFAHLTPERNSPGKQFREHVEKYFTLKNKTVLDFGGGGGYFGKSLFDDFGITKYIDIDISERSLQSARNIMAGYNAEFHLNTNQSFLVYNADCFISRAVIHHFPSLDYLNNFLVRLDESKIPSLYLTIKVCKGKEYEFIENSYEKGLKLVSNACLVNVDYIPDNLNNYRLVYGYVDKKNQGALVLSRIGD